MIFAIVNKVLNQVVRVPRRTMTNLPDTVEAAGAVAGQPPSETNQLTAGSVLSDQQEVRTVLSEEGSPSYSPEEDWLLSAMTAKAQRAVYTLGIDVFFNARHYVRVNGQAGAIHPHSFRVNVKINHSVLPGEHYTLGFAEARHLVQEETNRFNDTLLNEVYPFNNGYNLQPTTENLAAVLFQKIRRRLSPELSLESVTVWESPTNYVTYTEEIE